MSPEILTRPPSQSPTTIHPATAEAERADRIDADQQHWLRQAASVCERAARGDLGARLLHIDVDPDTDMGRLLHAINSQLDYMEAFVREVKAVLSCAAAGRHFRRVPLGGMLGDYLTAVRAINEAAAEMQVQSERLERSRADRLAVADEFEESVKSVIDSVVTSVDELQATSQALEETASAASEDAEVARDSFTQSLERIQSIAKMTDELHHTVDRISETTQQCTECTSRAVQEVEQASDVMVQLDQASHSISAVVQNIT